MTTKSDYQQNAEKWLTDHGLTMKIVYRNRKPHPWDGPGGRHYEIIIQRGRDSSELKFDFWGSLKDMEKGVDPDEYGVLYSVSCEVYNPETFEDFCSTFGYDTDSRKAYAMFEQCNRFSKRLRAFFTKEEQESLQEIQ